MGTVSSYKNPKVATACILRCLTCDNLVDGGNNVDVHNKCGLFGLVCAKQDSVPI